MRRNNQRLFRAAWRILRNHEDAEDAVQRAYLKAFAAIKGFAGRSSLSTWLTRIVTNDALSHARGVRRRRSVLEESEVPILDDYREMLMRGSMSVSPERAVARRQIRQLLDDAINQLPAPFRMVFVLRQIEELDVGEVAETLGIPAATVKTRHLRARRRLQRVLGPDLKGALSGKFPFDRAGSSGRRPVRAASRRLRNAEGVGDEPIADPVSPEQLELAVERALDLRRAAPELSLDEDVHEAFARMICACVLGIEDELEGRVSGPHAAILDEVMRRVELRLADAARRRGFRSTKPRNNPFRPATHPDGSGNVRTTASKRRGNGCADIGSGMAWARAGRQWVDQPRQRRV